MSYEIIYKYKDFEIEKKTKYYSQGRETWYVIVGVSDRIFDRLKDAKYYIDVTLCTTDYTAYGGKKELNTYQKPFGYK